MIQDDTPFPRWAAWLFPAVSGVLLWLAWPNGFFPGFASWNGWLAFPALIPFVLAWRRSTPWFAFAAGWIMGIIYFMGMLSWFHLLNQETKSANVVAQVFFSVCGAIYFGLASASARWVKARLQVPSLLVLPLAWTAWEFVRGHILTGGWPWGSLGHTQYANPVFRQVAAVAGVGGISFLIVLINSLIAKSLICRPRPAAAVSPPRAWVTGLNLALAAVWAVLLGIGVWEGIQFYRLPKSTCRLALIQGNFNTQQRWDEAYKHHVLDQMAGLHSQAASVKPDLVVWAESCFPGILEYEPEADWDRALRALIARHEIPTVLTSNEYVRDYDREGTVYHHYNSAFLLSGSGETLGRYRKMKLVPFGEYIPFNFLKNYLRAVVREPIPVDFEPGQDYVVFRHSDWAFSPLICYEDHFEEHAFQLARAGARFFLALANDGWSGRSAMSTQHSAMSVFLAVENRAYVAKADMTGPTCVIDPWGNMTQPLDYFTAGWKLETIHPAQFRPFFSKVGNLFPFLCLLIFGGLLVAAGLRKTGAKKL